MKENYSVVTKATLIFIGCLFLAFSAKSTAHRVNNADNSADFQSIQAAINDDISVSDGDTLFVEGSAFLYSGFSCDRLLYIIGPGFRLAENPQTGANASFAVIAGAASFVAGSEGSVLSGFAFDDAFSSYEPDINADNITIMRCYLTEGLEFIGNVNNTIILQNYFVDRISLAFSTYSFQGVIFNNNIVDADVNITTSISSPRTFASIENNFFLEDVVVTAGRFRNNIWWPLEVTASVNVSAGIEEHNLFFNAILGTENNNQGFTDGADVFGDRSGRSFDEQWRLADDSAFKNSGHDGTDPGPFGGASPYILSGVPPLPVIYEIDASGFGNQETGLPVTIKVRSSN